ncbi:MAG: bifunctional (p)ppGpp synthetase/guanosine-3',5'-bis(diphosphate) 3'-pyrophosphohydrolase [Eubacteriales bacterium]|nr:bifunctional (p)ppGpp synthetase/guanosine-3',5'-bis(diphosphate) 3'-pyrophosphohydrolase [bacterium]MDY2791552.1 bifunctional (p)ppGpp synthetase/guanosine-3',5'-bis(diphosphate) 3'-pyrophosphohydrolase [Eubacteriales bacterium]
MNEPAAMDLDQQLQQILTKIQKYHPKDDLSLVTRAYQFACEAHKDQKRKSGEPYIIHPVCVASILADLMLDSTTVAAGFLHDCVEDNKDVTVETIEAQFGPEVALLVDGVTKLKRLDFTSREDQQAESLRKMFLAMAKDIRVVLIKLADRLHNMRTLKYQSPDRQVAIARETLDVYAPLCHRLGMSTLKWEMEDLALRYIDPAGYYDLVEKVGQKRKEREHAIQVVISALKEQLDQAGIHCEIAGRPKHFYSIYRKLKTQGKTFDQIYDLIAVRVLVDTIPDCYAVLGIVHTMWTQVPNRFKDYISMPKGNMYQSLHTTVVGTSGELRGQTFEVQIRTWEMHRTAEYGIAAHWRYKEGKQVDSLDNKLYWLRQILDWQNETHDPSEFMDALKVDLFSDEVFVFTPKGDIVNLPRGATPVDFAYHIHSAIGNKCIGAKINGRIVPLETELQTGDFVEVLTSSNSKGPSMDWLKLCKTSEAKSKIRAYLKHELRDENLARGRDILDHEAKRQGYSLSQLVKNEFMESIERRYSIHSMEDLYVTVGFGGLSGSQVINRLIEEYRKANKQAEPVPAPKPAPAPARSSAVTQHHSNGVIVEGDSDMLVRFARCCNPLPGDDIVGYITRGRGVSIHRSDCPNMADMMQTPERFIDVKWENEERKEDANAAYEANIRVIAYDRLGLFADISTMLSQMEIPIVSISARIDKSKARHTTCIDLILSITDTKQLERVIDKLRKRGDILEVFRLTA